MSTGSTGPSPATPRRRAPRGHGVWLLVLALWALGSACAIVNADSFDDRRVRTGARLLRSLLAADSQLDPALANADAGPIRIGIYAPDAERFEQIAAVVRPPQAATAAIRRRPLQIERLSQLPVSGPAPHALFFAQSPNSAELDAVIEWSFQHHVLLYSPFEGHVERGVHAGLSIESKVQPYVNRHSLQRSGIRLKPFFMRVAKVYP